MLYKGWDVVGRVVTIELPQPRRQPRPSAADWSAADELAALETVWDSLCQDAARPAATLQLPVLSRSLLSRDGGRRSLRRLQRRRSESGRIAS